MKLKKYDSINVIPFIDVLLVLLTIVLMTSTFISKGIIPISLPTATNANNIKVNISFSVSQRLLLASTKNNIMTPAILEIRPLYFSILKGIL